jgi:PAS domain S-box-containing protein
MYAKPFTVTIRLKPVLQPNKGAEKIYGYTAQEILGRPISVLIPPGYPNELPEIMARLQRGAYTEI